MNGTFTVYPEGSDFPSSQGFVVKLVIDGVDEIFHTPRIRLDPTKNWGTAWQEVAVREGRKHAQKLIDQFIQNVRNFPTGHVNFEIRDAITDALKEKKAKIDAELQAFQNRLDLK